MDLSLRSYVLGVASSRVSMLHTEQSSPSRDLLYIFSLTTVNSIVLIVIYICLSCQVSPVIYSDFDFTLERLIPYAELLPCFKYRHIFYTNKMSLHSSFNTTSLQFEFTMIFCACIDNVKKYI